MTKTMRKKAPRAKVETTRKRARTVKGTFKADDPSTPHINEAFVQEKTKWNAGHYMLAFIILAGIVAIRFYSQ